MIARNDTFVIVISVALCLSDAAALCAVTSVAQAEKLLDMQNHVKNAFHYFAPNENSLEMAYKDQLVAIRYLSRKHDPRYLSILIPYLDYPVSAIAAVMPTADPKVVWPAYAAILDIPHPEDALTDYIRDDKRPLDLRLTALVVLRDKDVQSYKHCLDLLKSDNVGNSQMLKLLSVFESQQIKFYGRVELSTLEKLADSHAPVK